MTDKDIQKIAAVLDGVIPTMPGTQLIDMLSANMSETGKSNLLNVLSIVYLRGRMDGMDKMVDQIKEQAK